MLIYAYISLLFDGGNASRVGVIAVDSSTFFPNKSTSVISSFPSWKWIILFVYVHRPNALLTQILQYVSGSGIINY